MDEKRIKISWLKNNNTHIKPIESAVLMFMYGWLYCTMHIAFANRIANSKWNMHRRWFSMQFLLISNVNSYIFTTFANDKRRMRQKEWHEMQNRAKRWPFVDCDGIVCVRVGLLLISSPSIIIRCILFWTIRWPMHTPMRENWCVHCRWKWNEKKNTKPNTKTLIVNIMAVFVCGIVSQFWTHLELCWHSNVFVNWVKWFWQHYKLIFSQNVSFLFLSSVQFKTLHLLLKQSQFHLWAKQVNNRIPSQRRRQQGRNI